LAAQLYTTAKNYGPEKTLLSFLKKKLRKFWFEYETGLEHSLVLQCKKYGAKLA
jgi:hypothetical protein